MAKTTIQIDELTHYLLKRHKASTGASSYNDAINKLLREHLGIPGSIFGMCPELPQRYERRKQ